MWMLRALWLVIAHNLLEYRYMDDVIGNFVFFVLLNTACCFENVWEIISDKTSESLQKSLAGAVYKERKQKELSTTWECLNCKKSSQRTIATVCHRYERLSDKSKTFLRLFYFERVKALKNFLEKLCKEVKKNWDKKQHSGLKNA